MCVQGSSTKITLSRQQPLYLGGHVGLAMIDKQEDAPNDDTGNWRYGISEIRMTEGKSGFVGCVGKLQVNEKEYDMRKGAFVGDAVEGFDVGQ